MHTNSMPHFSLRMTSTTPLSSCIVTASGPLLVPVPALAVLLLLLGVVPPAVEPLLAGGSASSMLSRSVPLLCMVYKLAATVPWVRRVATGMGGCDA